MFNPRLFAALTSATLVGVLTMASSMVSAQPYNDPCHFLADRHIARGINCDTCHDQSLRVKQLNGNDICVACHGGFDKMSVQTAGRNPNPHAIQGNIACTSCHKGHK